MPKTILVADDSSTIRKVIEMILATENVQIISVDNGVDAVTQAQARLPDLAFLDVAMPGKTGFEVCQVLKGNPQTQKVPVYLLTGTFEPFDEALAAKVQADGHLVKPFESQTLLDKVRSVTGHGTEPSMPVAPQPTPAPMVPVATAAARPSAVPLPRPSVAAPAPVSTSLSTRIEPTGSAAIRSSVSPAYMPASARVPMSSPSPLPSAPSSDQKPVVSPQVVRPQATRPVSPAPISARPTSPSYARTGAFVTSPGYGAARGRDPFGLGTQPPATSSSPTEALPVPLPAYAAPRASGVTGNLSSNTGAPSFAPAAPVRPTSDGGEAALRDALSKASREVIEKIAWEVVPQLAETIIREHVERYMKERESKN